MKSKIAVALSMVFLLGFFSSLNSQTIKIERLEKTGWVELNGVRYFNNFFAMVEIEYYEAEFVWGITSKVIKGVFITGYKFCPPNVQRNVPWTSTGGRLQMRKVDSNYRFNPKNPLFSSSIIGQTVWLEFPGYLD